MDSYVGLDVSQRQTSICVVDGEGQCLWQGTCASEPAEMARALGKHAAGARLIGLETGPLAVWHWHALRALGLPAVCLHARHAHAAIAMQLNKADRNDAYALAQIMRTGWYRAVEVKSMEAHRIRLMLSARTRVVAMRVTLYGQIRGLLKTFGIVLRAGRGRRFEASVRQALAGDPRLEAAIGPLLGLWAALTVQLQDYDRQAERAARAHRQRRPERRTVQGFGRQDHPATRLTAQLPEIA